MRSAIGVVPGAAAVTVCGMSTVSGSASASAFCFCWGSGISPRLHPATASKAMPAAAIARLPRGLIAYSGIQAS